MERIAFVIKVREDKIEEYKRLHNQTPIELQAEVKASGVRNHSLWMRPDGTVFGYLECERWQDVLDYMSRSKVNADWQARMHDFQEQPPGAKGAEWIEMLELIHLTE